MSRLTSLALLLAVGSACGFAPIEDEARIGPVVQVKNGFTSCFLMPLEEGGVVLVDTCSNGKARQLLDALQARDLTAADVTDVLVTHGHGDHVGGLSVFSDARVHALGAERERIEGTSGVTVDVALEDGQQLAFGEHTVEVFATPGHTEGHAAFLVDGILMLGDAAVATNDGLVAPVPRSFSEDPDEAERSLAALAGALSDRTEDVSSMAFHHSGALDGVQPLLDWAAARED